MKSAATVVLVLTSALIAAQLPAALQWRAAGQDSRVGFVATYDGIPFEGWFESFDADIRFDPKDLEGSSFDIRIDTASLDSNSRDRDEGMQDGEWFAVEKHPSARFRTRGFERVSNDRYRALGDLTIKGITRSIEVPFAWRRLSVDEARIEAETHVDRRDFNIGSGEWAEDDIIGFDVTVRARLTLSRSQ